MKLRDFLQDTALNELRRQMGADLHQFVPAPRRETITEEELEALTTKGIEIPLEAVQLLNDGTFVYKDRRVVVYIRDQAIYQHDEISLPKFHLAMCRTLEGKRRDGSYEARYVVAAPEKQMFKIQRIRNNKVISARDEELDVCQNCLATLAFRNFSPGAPPKIRAAAVKRFSLKDFFDEYGRSPVWKLPDFDAVHAPTNVYSHDFFLISKGVKERRGFTCEDLTCRRDMSHPSRQRYLHAHHKNRDKSDNRLQNLKLLCVYCHGKEHPQLRNTLDYKAFCTEFGLAN